MKNSEQSPGALVVVSNSFVLLPETVARRSAPPCWVGLEQLHKRAYRPRDKEKEDGQEHPGVETAYFMGDLLPSLPQFPKKFFH